MTAIALYTELITMDRFAGLDELASYVGLIPSVTGSDEREIDRGLTCRHNRHLRYLLIEAAWVAVRKDPALLQTFTRLTRRMKTNKAIVRIAKKLLNRMRYVWTHQTCYVMHPVVENMSESVITMLTKQAETLTLPEYIELIEHLVRRLREKNIPAQEQLDWQELYGLGKGLWADEDAQEYVNRLREERV